jgi:hypothetical protein
MRMWEKEDAYEEDGRWRLRMQAEGEVAKLDCGSGFRASRVELSVRRRSGGREGGVGKREKRARERERERERERWRVVRVPRIRRRCPQQVRKWHERAQRKRKARARAKIDAADRFEGQRNLEDKALVTGSH